MGTSPVRASGAATIRRKRPDQIVPERFSMRALARCLAGFACAGTLLLASCSRPAGPSPFVAIDHDISPQPSRVGPASVTLKPADASGKPITGAHILIEANMSHAGMSPRFAEAKEEQPGRYQAHVDFPMAGDWIILLHITLPGGTKVERQIEVSSVRPN